MNSPLLEWKFLSPDEQESIIRGMKRDLEYIVRRMQMIPFKEAAQFVDGPLCDLFYKVGVLGERLEVELREAYCASKKEI